MRIPGVKFRRSTLFHRGNEGLVMLLHVVDNIMFPSDNQKLLREFKEHLQLRFDVNLYGKLTSFIRWSVVRTGQDLTIHQNQYTSRLLRSYDYANCNTV